METGDPAEATGENPVQARAEAAAAVASDPETASLLARYGAGEALSQKEYGKVGALKRTWKSWFGGKTDEAAGSSQVERPKPVAGNPADLATDPEVEASPDGLPPVPVDAALVQRTTDAVLTRCESIARRYVGTLAREAGAEGPALARFDSAACLRKDDRQLIVELSPDVCTSLGLNPKNYPLAVCIGTLGLWSTDLWLAIEELKRMKRERHAEAKSPSTNGAK